MQCLCFCVVFLVVIIKISPISAEISHRHRNELSFELGPEITCFSEEYHDVQNFTFEFHVIRGDKVNVWIKNPQDENLYSAVRSKGDVFTFFTSEGMFQFCLEKKKSLTVSFERVVVYLRLESTFAPSLKVRVDEDSVPGPFGMGETVCDTIYLFLSKIRDFQKSYRLHHESGRYFAALLGSRIAYVAPLTTVALLVVGLGQTLFLRRMFEIQNDRRPIPTSWISMPDSPH